jgi:hypothetical protein
MGHVGVGVTQRTAQTLELQVEQGITAQAFTRIE